MTKLRKLTETINPYLFQGKDKKKAIVIYGPRQVGKTTLVKDILNKHPEKAQYFNCDYFEVQEQFAYERASQLGNIVRNLNLLVLDEAHRIKNIGLVIKILVDEFPHLQVIATGSSSFDLSNDIQEPLTGRKHEFHLYPFALSELVHDPKDTVSVQEYLHHSLRFGSYPVAALSNESEARVSLQELTSSYLFKDIFLFQQIKKSDLLDNLLRLLAFQVGSEVSYQELATSLKVDQTVVQRYVSLLEQAFVIFRLEAFSRNLRKEITKSRKIYFWDLGVRNSLIRNHNILSMRDDVGALWENYCIVERMKQLEYAQQGVNRYFWRTYDQKEIDYIEEEGGTLQAYEFKWKKDIPIVTSFAKQKWSTVGNAATGVRKEHRVRYNQIKPPHDFTETYPNSSFRVLTPDDLEFFYE
jgi:hypothetical protein